MPTFFAVFTNKQGVGAHTFPEEAKSEEYMTMQVSHTSNGVSVAIDNQARCSIESMSMFHHRSWTQVNVEVVIT